MLGVEQRSELILVIKYQAVRVFHSHRGIFKSPLDLERNTKNLEDGQIKDSEKLREALFKYMQGK